MGLALLGGVAPPNLSFCVCGQLHSCFALHSPPLDMHAKYQREMVEKKRRGVPNRTANSVKLTETANTVDSLALHVECLERPENIQAWLR